MKFGIIELNVVPVRKKNDAKSEMINQLFFGETIRILNVKNKWSFIESDLDKYQGWIRNLHFNSIFEKDYCKVLDSKREFCSSEINICKSNHNIIIPTGSLISSAKFLNYTLTKKNKQKPLLETIKSFINTPYLWGGKTKFGVDCSGFVQSVFKTINIILPRDSKDQIKIGIEIKDDFKFGDLVFFGENINKITHVGIVFENNKVVHAYGKVRIDELKSNGIYNHEERRITHYIQKIKRII